MSRELIFTVDVDRDVNMPVKGCLAAGSIDRGAGVAPRFSSSELGLRLLCDLLDEVGVRGTFFVEGRTSEIIDCSPMYGSCVGFHGYDHEDLSGESTGVKLTSEETYDVLSRGLSAVEENVGRPTCFRAPYMTADESVLRSVMDMGVHCDSSSYYRVSEGEPVTEPIPGMTCYRVPKTRDRDGRNMAAYLWPMHEGKRPPSDYVGMASAADDGPLVLATHSWHIVEGRDGGLMDDAGVKENLRNVREVLEGILDLGFRSAVVRPRSV